MKITRTFNPMMGEHVLDVQPPLVPDGDPGWRRRLNLFTGRSLSDTALAAEQVGRAGRLAARGQMIYPGVVAGLEIAVEPVVETTVVGGVAQTRVVQLLYSLSAGMGVAASGEDVVVPTAVRVPVRDVRVYAPTYLLGEVRPGETSGFGGAGGVNARDLGPPLGEFIQKNVDLPRVGILVLQPVMVELIGRLVEGDPCERDPQSDVYDDWQLADGCRLVYYAWPTELLPLPPRVEDGTGNDARWRNRIAYAIFGAERSLGPDEALPWEEVGVPVGLAAFSPDWQSVRFLDRFTVVRAGGRPRRRSEVARPRSLRSTTPAQGNPFLWQARMQQLAEQIADIGLADFGAQANSFAFLPPAGLLSRNVCELLTTAEATQRSYTGRTGRRVFFPNSYVVDAAPIPVEQLDAALEASAGLAPFDLSLPDQVQMLVPVPQLWYEPGLLQIEQVDPAFQTSLAQLRTVRGRWLSRRQVVRAKASSLVQAITGSALTFPSLDPQALEMVEELADSLDATDPRFKDSEDAYGTTVRSGQLVVDAMASLTDKLLATCLKSNEVDQLATLGLERFVTYLQAKVDAADDQINLSFLRLQADIYRVRQHMLGSVVGSRLAVSPALASIVQGDSALATREDITKYYEQIKAKPAQVGVKAALVIEGADVASPDVVESQPRVTSFGALDASLLKDAVDLAGASAELNLRTTRGAFGSVLTGAQRQALPVEVVGQTPIVGMPPFRTTSVVERLQPPKAQEAREFSVSGKAEVVTNVKNLMDIGLNVDDLAIPIRKEENGKPVRVTKFLKDINFMQDLLDFPAVETDDESAHFGAAVDFMDDTAVILRLLEGRIQAYREAIASVQKVLGDVRALAQQVNRRLGEIADELAEARHDVSLALALLVDEQLRVDAINARRDQVIREHVTFLAFRRPRYTELRMDTPARTIDPGQVVATIPACLASVATAPADLQSLIALFRNVPVNWFAQAPKLVDRLNALHTMQAVLQVARSRAVEVTATEAIATIATVARTAKTTSSTRARFAESITLTYQAQVHAVTQARAPVAQVDLGQLAGQSWTSVRDQALALVSLGDLADGKHGRSDVSQLAAAEIDDITRIATCLYAAMGNVLPVLRLEWAERLSQYDAPVDLRNLASLPRWGEIEYLDRRTMQQMVDWLFGRVNAARTGAVALMNDVVRVCILLASHTPVNQIITGHVVRRTAVGRGARIDLSVADVSKVRVGMGLLLYKGQQIVAQAVVEDLGAGQVAARVTSVQAPGADSAAPSVTLEADDVVHFSDHAEAITPGMHGKPFAALARK